MSICALIFLMCFVPVAISCLIKSKKGVIKNLNKKSIQLSNRGSGINEDVTDVESAEKV